LTNVGVKNVNPLFRSQVVALKIL